MGVEENRKEEGNEVVKLATGGRDMLPGGKVIPSGNRYNCFRKIKTVLL